MQSLSHWVHFHSQVFHRRARQLEHVEVRLMEQDWFGVKKEFLFRVTNSTKLKELKEMFERFSCTIPTQVALQREPCLLFPISPSHPPEENDRAGSIYQRSVRKDALEGAPLLQDPRSYIAGYNLGIRLSTTGRG